MTDQEVLAKYRARHGHVTLSEARALEKLDKQFAHLKKQKESS